MIIRILRIASTLIVVLAAAGFAATDSLTQSPLPEPERGQLRTMQRAYDYQTIVKTYAQYMIEHGRDTYGKEQSPLFSVIMDRSTGTLFTDPGKVPYPNVKTRPFAPGYERENKMRPYDRTYTGANPIDDLSLFKILYRLSEITGDNHYREEADKANRWWMAHTQSKVTGLYPWGTHIYWDFYTDAMAGAWNNGMEMNRPWPYWALDRDALKRFACGLWDHAIADKRTGNFNRHVIYGGHGPGVGMEFGWPGSAFISTWAEEYVLSKDPEMKRAILTVLGRWDGLRDPKTGAQSASSSYLTECWANMNLYAANVIDEAAARVEPVDRELAETLRDYGRKTDNEYLSKADERLNVRERGLLHSYDRSTGAVGGLVTGPDDIGFPLRDATGLPAASLSFNSFWFPNRMIAYSATLLWQRSLHTSSEPHRQRYRQAVLETAEMYLSLEPEIQWPVYSEQIAQVMEVLLGAHEITGSPAYLRRADHLGHLAINLFMDDVSPLPKMNHFNPWYECKNGADNRWLLNLLELDARWAKAGAVPRYGKPMAADNTLKTDGTLTAGMPPDQFTRQLQQSIKDGMGGVFDCTRLTSPTPELLLAYGVNGEKSLALYRVRDPFTPAEGLDAGGLDLILSDVINHVPTAEEAAPFDGVVNAGFTGRGVEESTAREAGFKELLRQAGLVLVNRGQTPSTVRVTATFNDTYHDNGRQSWQQLLAPGQRALVACASPDRKYLRRLDLASEGGNGVRVEHFAFVMAKRTEVNPPPPTGPTEAGPTVKSIYQDYAVQILKADHYYALNETKGRWVYDTGGAADKWYGVYQGAGTDSAKGSTQGPDKPYFTAENRCFFANGKGSAAGPQGGWIRLGPRAGTGNCTVAMWVKINANQHYGWQRLFKTADDSNCFLIGLHDAVGAPTRGVHLATGTKTGTARHLPATVKDIADSQWHHLFATRTGPDRAQLKLAVDGVDYSASLTDNDDSWSGGGNDWCIAARGDPVNWPAGVAGSVDEVAVWPATALGVRDGMALYHAPLPEPPR
ncbi:MAG: hypothetical protein NTW21_27305 [Verrucomicrobia bacterium]|nr:hypothetical protein [Verrucomicrobiota bacterium]